VDTRRLVLIAFAAVGEELLGIFSFACWIRARAVLFFSPSRGIWRWVEREAFGVSEDQEAHASLMLSTTGNVFRSICS
jgi:hypothetical protein